MKVQVKPWTDERGRMLSEVDLKIRSRKWTPDIWESYLQTLEGKQSGRKYSSEIYDDYCGELVESIFSVVTNESDALTRNTIEEAIQKLSHRQAEVLRLIFWEGKSQNRIAKDWGVQQSSVFNLKQRALERLRKSLEKMQGAVNSRLMKGEENSSLAEHDYVRSDIEEVMNAEINRNATHEAYWRSQK